MQSIAKPSEITPAKHAEILSLIVTALSKAQADNIVEHNLRVRDFDFILEQSVPTIQVFLSVVTNNSETKSSAPLSCCAKFHRWLLDNNIFSMFNDNISIEVSSEGIEPPLRFIDDFIESIGKHISLELWEKIDNQSKVTGILASVNNTDTSNPVLAINTVSNTAEYQLVKIRRAYVMLKAPKEKRKKSNAKNNSFKA